VTNANMIASWRSLSNARAETEPRSRTLKGRTIAYNYGVGINCPIRNLEGHSACLEREPCRYSIRAHTYVRTTSTVYEAWNNRRGGLA